MIRMVPTIDYQFSPMFAAHNMPCPVCRQENAVIRLTADPHDHFLPCWKCQKLGWMTFVSKGWKHKLIKWLIK